MLPTEFINSMRDILKEDFDQCQQLKETQVFFFVW